MVSSQSFEGTCHCGAIGYIYRTALPTHEWTIRECQCRFCRTHAALSTSDPAGSLEFVEFDRDAMRRYQFGLRSADFLLCGNCGVYVGALMQTRVKRFGIINVRALNLSMASLPEVVEISYEGEEMAERLARRENRWTPVA